MSWVVETYRVARSGDPDAIREALHEFRRVVEFSFTARGGREFMGRGGKEMFILMEELEPMLERTLRRIEEIGQDEAPTGTGA